MTTALFKTMQTTEAAFQADALNFNVMRTADTAYAAYFTATEAARAVWEAIPDSDAKYSAEINANESEGTHEDRLHWFQIATATYHFNLDGGDYNADGSDKA